MLLESYHMMMDEMSQDQAPNLKLEIYINLRKNPPLSYFLKCFTEGTEKKTIFNGFKRFLGADPRFQLKTCQISVNTNSKLNSKEQIEEDFCST
jgi:hypothetical protein